MITYIDSKNEAFFKKQAGDIKVCRTCGSKLNHGGPAGYYSPAYMIATCPICKWSCTLDKILDTSK